MLYVSGNVTVCPTDGVAGDGVPTVTPGATLTFTVTVAVCGDVVVAPVPVPVLAVMPAVAVTFAIFVVVSVVCALPFTSETTVAGETAPASVVNDTGIDAIRLPLTSIVVAVMSEVPPFEEMTLGFASMLTLPTAAAPTAILMALAPLAEAPPELAVMMAVPLDVPALKVTTTLPPLV